MEPIDEASEGRRPAVTYRECPGRLEIPLEDAVCVALHIVEGAEEQLVEHPQVGAGTVGDHLGWTVYLDTVVPRLVEYYARAGFDVVAAVATTYAGEDVVVT